MCCKSIIRVAILTATTLTLSCSTAIGAPEARANIQSVTRKLEKDVTGKRVLLVTIRTTQQGVQFFGNLRYSFEITDGSGQRHFGGSNFKQASAYRSATDCEWRIDIHVEGIDKPVLTGYAIEYFAPGIQESLDTKTSSCKDATSLADRNKDSNTLGVSGRSVTVIGGRN